MKENRILKNVSHIKMEDAQDKNQDQDVNNRLRKMSHKIAEHGRKLRRRFGKRERGGEARLLH
jgi:hypothetical protein